MSTKCWSCTKACGGCSWSSKLEPVDGWLAVPTRIAVNRRKGIYTDSYLVISCPEYEHDDREYDEETD